MLQQLLGIPCLLCLIITGSAVAVCQEDGKVKLVKEMKSYQVQPNCTVKCSMYCELDGLQIMQELPLPVQTIREQTSTDNFTGDSCNTTQTVTTLVTITPSPSPKVNFRTCKDALNNGKRLSGVYTIHPDSLAPFDVYCDMDTDGGGWTVFQRRQDGSEQFFRGWYYYANGFGNLTREHWLGLDKLNRLTSGTTRSELRIDMEDFSGGTRYAQYSSFRVGDASTKYQLEVSGYTGTAGDSMSYHSGSPFSTYDQDNDAWYSNCAASFKGAWWHKTCHYSNLNGKYLRGSHATDGDGVNWYHWKGHFYSLKFTEMKFRAAE